MKLPNSLRVLLDDFLGRHNVVRKHYPLGTIVHARRPGDFTPGKVVGYRACTLESCGGTSLGVRWSNGSITWPCVQGMAERLDGSLEIE